jgi:hypothetical protein
VLFRDNQDVADVDGMRVQEDEGVSVFIDDEGALNSLNNVAKYAVPITHLDSIGYHNMEAI